MARESQYVERIKQIEAQGLHVMGPMASWAWHDDPRHLLFTLSRYKFVSKMFAGFDQVLEIGCGDGFASRMVRQSVNHLVATDFDEHLIESATKYNRDSKWPVDFRVYDPTQSSMEKRFDGIYALDVMEHISPEDEHAFVRNISKGLKAAGVLILGMPSLESQAYASPQSKEGHVNCKTQTDFRLGMLESFENVLMFSMNDEVVHTGYEKMSHYHFAVCTGFKE